MSKLTSKIIMTAAAAGLAIAPISAQANTRAGDSSPVYTNDSDSQPGLYRDDDGEGIVGVPGIIIGIFAAAAVIGGVIIVSSENDDDEDGTQSPGA